MADRLSKIITDSKPLYVIFNTVVDQFVTPAFDSLKKLRTYVKRRYSADLAALPAQEWKEWEQETDDIHDLRRETIHRCTLYLATLKRGKSLTDEQGVELYNFYLFLKGTVAPHQYTYPEIGEAAIEKWLKELNLRSRYPENWDWWEILHDKVIHDTFYNPWARQRYAASFMAPEVSQPTPEENKVAGRYVSKMAMIAQIAGTDRLSPAQIIQKFLGKKQD